MAIQGCDRKKEGYTTMASFKCKDIGMKCEFEIKDENRDELMWVVAMHADETHNLKQDHFEIMDKVKKAIKK